MTYVSIDFDDYEPYADNRPRGKVVLQGPGGYHGSTWLSYALVDTGCDFLHLPEEAAYAVGIDLSNATKVRVLTAGGEIYMAREMVDVEIQGEQVNVPCNFGQEAKPLIGMQAIFETMETSGFSSSKWLLDWYTPSSATQTATAQPQKPVDTESFQAFLTALRQAGWRESSSENRVLYNKYLPHLRVVVENHDLKLQIDRGQGQGWKQHMWGSYSDMLAKKYPGAESLSHGVWELLLEYKTLRESLEQASID